MREFAKDVLYFIGGSVMTVLSIVAATALLTLAFYYGITVAEWVVGL